MGITAVAPSAETASIDSFVSVVGTSPNGLYVVVALVILLAYLNLLDASEEPQKRIRPIVVAWVCSLGVAFSGILVFRSVQII